MSSVRLSFLLIMLSGLLFAGNLFGQEPTVPSQPDSGAIDNSEKDSLVAEAEDEPEVDSLALEDDSEEKDLVAEDISKEDTPALEDDSEEDSLVAEAEDESEVDSLALEDDSEEDTLVSEKDSVEDSPVLKAEPPLPPKNITGTITDLETGKPLHEVTVKIKGTAISTVSDKDGKYSIEVKDEDTTLVFSLDNYKSEEIDIDDEPVIDVMLESNIQKLEKMVVVGYGTTKKGDLTGSVSSIEAKDLEKSAGFSIEQALQGKAAGVTVTQNSGAPGKDLSIRIRGVGTINNSEPLYVVDGIATAGIDYLNPGDIESISILKDASAAAIYGSRGANGVVLITTKKGKEGQQKITYDVYAGAQFPWKNPSMCSAEEWAILNNEAHRAAGVPVQTGLENPASLGTGTDWFDEITREYALMHNHNVSIMRGTEKLKYFLSFGYFSQEGIIEGTDYRKITARINAENKIFDWLSIGNNFGYSNILKNSADESDEWNSIMATALSIDPVSTPTDASGNLIQSKYTKVPNPVGVIEHTNDEDKENRIMGSLFADVNIANAINYRVDFGMDLSYLDNYTFKPAYNLGPNETVQLATVRREYEKDISWSLVNTATYKKAFGENHNAKLTAATTMENTDWEDMSAENQGTPGNDQSQQWLDATFSNNATVGGVGGGNSLLSYLGRLNYNFDYKYFLTATLRGDGSSRFGPLNRWGLFPSIAGGWKVSNEPFMENVSFINNLKIRGGWGKIGNQEIGDYLYTTTTSGKQNYVFNSEIKDGSTFLSAGNEEIGWEEQQSYNVGLDIEFLEGKIEFTGDYFNKKTSGMLTQSTIPSSVGLQEAPFTNQGEVLNRGFDFLANYKGEIKDFKVNISANFSTYRNKILSLGTGDEPIVDVGIHNKGFVVKTSVGRPVGSFYGYKTDGLFQNWNEVYAHSYVDSNGVNQLIQPNAAPGDIRYVDSDRDGQPDKYYIGNPHPDFTFGLTADFTYKGFDLGIFVQGSYGNDIFNATRFTTDDNQAYFGLDKRMLDRWTGEGTTNDPDLARMNLNDANNVKISDRYVEDGSYIRIKTLQLGYSLPESVTEKLKVSKFRIYIGAQNLFTFTKYSGLDPEIGKGENGLNTSNRFLDIGIDRGTYPQARSAFMGINLAF